MTFTRNIKEELCKLNFSKEENFCELASLLRQNAEVSLFPKKILFKSNNITVSRRFISLMKLSYKINDTTILVSEQHFSKSKQIQVIISDDIDKVFDEHNILNYDQNNSKIMLDDKTKAAYLRGYFLASGSVNDPKTAAYHLEIFCNTSDSAIFLQGIINSFELNSKITKRRNGFICYIKNVEAIIDFLRIIGAKQTVFSFEDIKIKRELNNSITRIMNVELANEKKVILLANQQVEDIKLIKQFYPTLDDKLEQAINIRLVHDELSLKELVEEFNKFYHENITKSGLNHRFIRIKKLADEIRNNIK